jgi:hypothetical protein
MINKLKSLPYGTLLGLLLITWGAFIIWVPSGFFTAGLSALLIDWMRQRE